MLVELHGRVFGLDGCGNLCLRSLSTSNALPSRGGLPGIVGKGIPFNMAISAAQGASSNHSSVSFQMQDIGGNPVAGVFEFSFWLSDAATGVGLTATTASGGYAALAASGAILDAGITSKSNRAQTNAAGLFVLDITDTAKTGFYPCAIGVPGFPVQVGTQLVAGNYK